MGKRNSRRQSASSNSSPWKDLNINNDSNSSTIVNNSKTNNEVKPSPSPQKRTSPRRNNSDLPVVNTKPLEGKEKVKTETTTKKELVPPAISNANNNEESSGGVGCLSKCTIQ